MNSNGRVLRSSHLNQRSTARLATTLASQQPIVVVRNLGLVNDNNEANSAAAEMTPGFVEIQVRGEDMDVEGFYNVSQFNSASLLEYQQPPENNENEEGALAPSPTGEEQEEYEDDDGGVGVVDGVLIEEEVGEHEEGAGALVPCQPCDFVYDLGEYATNDGDEELEEHGHVDVCQPVAIIELTEEQKLAIHKMAKTNGQRIGYSNTMEANESEAQKIIGKLAKLAYVSRDLRIAKEKQLKEAEARRDALLKLKEEKRNLIRETVLQTDQLKAKHAAELGTYEQNLYAETNYAEQMEELRLEYGPQIKQLEDTLRTKIAGNAAVKKKVGKVAGHVRTFKAAQEESIRGRTALHDTVASLMLEKVEQVDGGEGKKFVKDLFSTLNKIGCGEFRVEPPALTPEAEALKRKVMSQLDAPAAAAAGGSGKGKGKGKGKGGGRGAVVDVGPNPMVVAQLQKLYDQLFEEAKAESVRFTPGAAQLFDQMEKGGIMKEAPPLTAETDDDDDGGQEPQPSTSAAAAARNCYY